MGSRLAARTLQSPVVKAMAFGTGVQVLPLGLYPTLRATGAWNTKGEALDEH